MPDIDILLRQNQQWSRTQLTDDPEFFERLAAQQTPEYLWIGCSDSRVPANQVTGLAPGEVFVHRNIANVVAHSDFNCLSVVEFAVAILKVKHIIVCGHYGCGGVGAALKDHHLGLIDNWLRHIRDVRQKHDEELAAIESDAVRIDRLCELNVMEQVSNVCHSTTVQQAWERGQDLTVHGWIYGLRDGLIKDLDVSFTRGDEIPSAYRVNDLRGRSA